MTPLDNMDIGDAADRPAPGPSNNEKFWFSEDTGELFLSDGTQWIDPIGGGGGPVPPPVIMVAHQNAPQTIDAQDPPIFVPVVFDYPVASDWTTPTPGEYEIPEDGLYEVESHVTMEGPTPGNSYAIRLVVDGLEAFKRESYDANNGPIPNGGILTSTMVLPSLTRDFVAGEIVRIEVSFNEAAPLDTVPSIQTSLKIEKVA